MKKNILRSNVGVKTIFPPMIILSIVGILLITLPAKTVKKHWMDNSLEVVHCDVDIVTDKINERIDNTEYVAKSIAGLYSSIADSDGKIDDSMLDLFCSNALENMGAQSVAVYDTKGNLISNKTYSPNAVFNDDITAALKGSTAKGLLVSQNNDVVTKAVVPVSVNEKVVAAVEVGVCISTYSFIQSFPKVVGCQFSMVKGDTRIQTTLDGLQNTNINSEIYQTLKSGKEWSGLVNINGQAFTCVYWPYEGVDDFYLFVGENTETMNLATKEISNTTALIAIIGNICILVLLILAVIYYVTKPLAATRKAIEGLSAGDADLTYRLPITSTDEIAQLSVGVNKFIELLQNMMSTIKKNSEKVNNVISELGSTASETASATTEIMANIESVKNQANNQVNAVSETSSVVAESSAHMNKLNSNIVAQTSDITESSAAIEEMIGNIESVSASAEKMTTSFQDLTSAIRQGSGNVKACSDIIAQVAEKSKTLADANNTIKSISTQTNLLAMNAMIESAHAGEAGKGFAVVAEEIRKLAENSNSQAGQIDQNIKEITELIMEGGNLSNLSQRSFESIDGQVNIVDPLVKQINDAMEEQTSGSSQILEALHNMKDESVTVDDSSRKVENGLGKIRNDMDMVAQVSNTILGSMDEMAAGSQQISRATQNVSELALNTKTAMDGINQLIGKFKV